jgi:hypothetical protein
VNTNLRKALVSEKLRDRTKESCNGGLTVRTGDAETGREAEEDLNCS